MVGVYSFLPLCLDGFCVPKFWFDLNALLFVVYNIFKDVFIFF
jgi:hypothetical protein